MSFARQSAPDALASFYPQLSGGPRLGPAALREVPNAPGLYTLWIDDEVQCTYVAIATKSLRSRIASNYSGNRSVDPFCLVAYDQFVYQLRSGKMTTAEVNRLTSEWIRAHVTFRFIPVHRRRSELVALEHELRRRLEPVLNSLIK